MQTHLQLKRTLRNANSKRKRRLRNRGMSPSRKFTLIPWKQRYAAVRAVSELPLRGVHADLRSTIPKSYTAPKRGFLSRLFRRKGT